MKFIHYLYIVPFTLLTACNSEDQASVTDNSGKEPIVLSAGIVEGSLNTVTRTGAEDHHTTPGHLTLTTNTALALQVSGKWNSDDINTFKATTATVGAETSSGSKHNSITAYDPVLYWDDYGSADPNNATKGRTYGLTIYGAAINGKTTIPATVSTTAGWTIAWTLNANQTTEGNTPADKDLLISNNVKGDNGSPYETDYGRYLFTERASGKLLEFTHALSKITVILTPGLGFANNKFDKTPEVTISTTNVGKTKGNPEWAITTGNVNVTTGDVDVTSSTKDSIYMHTADIADDGKVTKDALVMPGSEIPADGNNILRINADGNIYYVTVAKIRAKMHELNSSTDYKTEAGKNYIFNIIVNKTDIVVTATVADWTTVTAAVDEPVINVNADWGTTGSSTSNAFSFYRSTSLNNGYSNDASLIENSFYKPEATVSYASSAWSMSPTLYWPNHNTHYQFRGVYPQTVTTTGNDVGYPRVETATHSSVGYQVIKVKNVAYSANTFPSDLQIARPEIDASTLCSNNDHTKVSLYNVGICATEGTINLNFRYMMSQVEVNLTTSGSTATDRVDLSSAQVDLVNVYNTGDVKLGDREVILTGSPGEYTLGNFTYDSSNSKASYKSAVVPQELTYSTAQASTNMKFRITIKEGSVVKDIYYADVAPIKETGKTILVAPGPNDTNKTDATKAIWQAGYHYIYNLYLTKTEVKVTATLANWTTVNASENVWF